MFAFSIRAAKKSFSCNKLHFVKVNKPEPICSTWRLEQYPSCLKRLYVKKKIEVQTLSEHWVLFFCWTANEIRRSRIGRVNGWPAGVSHCRPAYIPYLSLSHCDKSLRNVFVFSRHFANMIRFLISQNERPII